MHERLYEEYVRKRETAGNIVESVEKRVNANTNTNTKRVSANKFTTFSRKNSEKSIADNTNTLQNKKNASHTAVDDPSEFVPSVEEKAKNNTLGN